MQRPLTHDDLLPEGPLRRLGGDLQLFTKISSTNAYLLANASRLPDGAVAHAEYQTAGRGRQGRSWIAPRGSSILMSILVMEPENSPLIDHAAMLGAVAAAQAVADETSCAPALRWPNDLTVNGRKLAGVLAESSPLTDDPEKRRALVVGVGVNCFQHGGHLTGELAGIATSLELECTEPIARARLGAALLQRLDDAFAIGNRTESHWIETRRRWTSRCEDIGARVRLVENSREFTGVVVDIGDDGELLVELEAGGRRQFAPATTTRIV